METGSERTSCIITAIKLASNPRDNVYTAVSDVCRSFKSELVLNLRDIVEIEKDALESGGTVGAASIKILGSAGEMECRSSITKFIKQIFRARRSAPDTIPQLRGPTKKMEKALGSAAIRLVRSALTGAAVLVRFHNDCDGSSGAIALYEALLELQKKSGIGFNLTWRMNKTVGYLKESLLSDTAYFNSFESVEKPIVFITDFGTTSESEDAIRSNDRCDFVWLDHHPAYGAFPKEKIAHYINTWNFGGDSDYTAGYLTCVFAEFIAPIDTQDLRAASLIGDFSVFGDRSDEEGQKLSIVLDYLTGKKESDGNITPKYMSSIIRNKRQYDETFAHSNRMLMEALELGVQKVKHYKARNSINVFVLDFKHIEQVASGYPLPGRYSSRLQEKLEEVSGGRALTMVHYGNYISLRANREVAREIGMLNILEGLKKSSEHVYSFGGHEAAASIRTDKEHIKHVVNLILHELGAIV